MSAYCNGMELKRRLLWRMKGISYKDAIWRINYYYSISQCHENYIYMAAIWLMTLRSFI